MEEISTEQFEKMWADATPQSVILWLESQPINKLPLIVDNMAFTQEDLSMVVILKRYIALEDEVILAYLKRMSACLMVLSDPELHQPCLHDGDWDSFGEGEFDFICNQCGREISDVPKWYLEGRE